VTADDAYDVMMEMEKEVWDPGAEQKYITNLAGLLHGGDVFIKGGCVRDVLAGVAQGLPAQEIVHSVHDVDLAWTYAKSFDLVPVTQRQFEVPTPIMDLLKPGGMTLGETTYVAWGGRAGQNPSLPSPTRNGHKPNELDNLEGCSVMELFVPEKDGIEALLCLENSVNAIMYAPISNRIIDLTGMGAINISTGCVNVPAAFVDGNVEDAARRWLECTMGGPEKILARFFKMATKGFMPQEEMLKFMHAAFLEFIKLESEAHGDPNKGNLFAGDKLANELVKSYEKKIDTMLASVKLFANWLEDRHESDDPVVILFKGFGARVGLGLWRKAKGRPAALKGQHIINDKLNGDLERINHIAPDTGLEKLDDDVESIAAEFQQEEEPMFDVDFDDLDSPVSRRRSWKAASGRTGGKDTYQFGDVARVSWTKLKRRFSSTHDE